MKKQAGEAGLIERAKNYFSALSKTERILWAASAASLALLAAVALLLSQGETAAFSTGGAIEPRSSFTASESPGSSKAPAEGTAFAARAADIGAAAARNPDTVGWLYIPGLSEIDKPVVQSTEDNLYYLYRDAEGNELTNNLQTGYHLLGAYYTHFRNTFGTREELSRNTVVFGHSDLGLNLGYADDDPDGTLFSQLYRFLDEDFARRTPYIYFSTGEEDMAFEIFAVGYCDAGKEYIEPEPGIRAFDALLANARARSRYDYDVEVLSEDKLLTLSTCTVHFGQAQKDEYRFVVTAKLVGRDAVLKDEASLSPNPDIEEKYRG